MGSDLFRHGSCWAEGRHFKAEEFDGCHPSRARVSRFAPTCIYTCNHRLSNSRSSKLKENMSASDEVKCLDAVACSVYVGGRGPHPIVSSYPARLSKQY